MTTGEQRFIEFCERHHIPCRKNSEQPNVRTPDFLAFYDREPLLVEVKDLNDNPNETRAIRQISDEGYAIWGRRPGDRIYAKIKDGQGQLKNNKSGVPTVLVIFDDRSPEVSMVSTYEIAVAMYGFETLSLNSSRKPRFSGHAQMTPDSRTYISAIGILTTKLAMDLYLNWYASVPLHDHRIVNVPDVKMYELGKAPHEEFSSWQIIANK